MVVFVPILLTAQLSAIKLMAHVRTETVHTNAPVMIIMTFKTMGLAQRPIIAEMETLIALIFPIRAVPMIQLDHILVTVLIQL